MKKLLYLVALGAMLTSCEKTEEFEILTNYQFEMVGRTSQDINGYYHLPLNPQEDKQTLHRFGAHITKVDKYNLPTQVVWACDAFWYTPDTLGVMYIETRYIDDPWSWREYTISGYEGMTVPIVNGTSHADLNMDSVFCMMAPIGAMIGDTVTIYGKASFEEGDVILEDNFNIIFE